MADDIHEPQLPGVKTYESDIAKTEQSKTTTIEGVTFTEKNTSNETTEPHAENMHAPEQTVRTQSEDNQSEDRSGNVFDVSKAFQGGAETGTIVTDKRIKRSHFGGILADAFNEWVADAKTTVKNLPVFQEEIVPTVTDPETREKTIQEAGALTKQAPRDDHAVLVENLKTMGGDAERITGRPFVIKQAEGKKEKATPRGSWTHIKKPKQTAAVAPTVTRPSQLQRPKRPPQDLSVPAFDPTQVPTEEETTLTQTPATQSHTVSNSTETSGWSFFTDKKQFQTLEHEQKAPSREHVPHTEAQPLAPTPTRGEVPEVTSTPKQTLTHAFQAPVAEYSGVFPSTTPQNKQPEDIRPDRAPTPEVSQLPLPSKSQHREKEPKNIRLVLIAGIALVSIAAGVSTAVLLFRNADTQIQTQTQIVIPSFIRTDAQIPVLLTNSKNEFLTNLQNTIFKAQNGIVQIYPTVESDSGDVRSATTQEVLTIVLPHLPSAAVRALQPGMVIGSVHTTQNEPFIIFQTHVFDTVFAGMLAWEPTMSADLAPLFGEPVTKTFDQKNGSVETAHFVDAIDQNRTIRVLYDSDGTERMLYAFLDKEFVIITKTTEGLSALLDRI